MLTVATMLAPTSESDDGSNDRMTDEAVYDYFEDYIENGLFHS